MNNKSIIYDGACTLCIRSKNTLLALGLAHKDYTWAYQEMPDKFLKQVDYERFRNEMALIDLDGGDTMYGPAAIVYLLSSKSQLLRFLFSIGPLNRLFAFCYKIIALNRTAIMVPRLKKVKCASCEPDTPPEYRWFWISFVIGSAFLFSMLMGVFDKNDLAKPSFFLGLLSLPFIFYLGLKKTKDNYLEILAHAASLFLMGILLISTSFYFMDIYGGSVPLSIWMLVFAGILFLLGRNYILRVDFLGLELEEKIFGAFFMGLVFISCYISLIF